MKHLTQSIATTKGHLDQEFKTLQPTKITSSPDEDIEPPQEEENMQINDIMCGIFATSELVSKSYLDQTGKFLATFTQGNKYIFILYHYDTNSMHTVPIKSRHTQNIIKVWDDFFSL